MKSQILNRKIKIVYPVTEQDFKTSLDIIEKNILKDKNWNLSYLKSLSIGEMLIVKLNSKIVGVLVQRRPGVIFNDLNDGYFTLEKIKVAKKDYGFVVLIAVDCEHQDQKIGKYLLDQALKQQVKWSSRAIGVHCWQASSNNASEKLFKSFGFEPLKIYRSPRFEYSKRLSIKDFECPVCGSPCKCDGLEMIIYV